MPADDGLKRGPRRARGFGPSPGFSGSRRQRHLDAGKADFAVVLHNEAAAIDHGGRPFR